LVYLNDAKALLRRAEARYTAYEGTIGPRKSWDVRKDQDPDTGDWRYAIQINAGVFDEARFIVGEAASLLSSSLDHLAAAIALANGVERPRLYFPIGFTDEEFEKSLAAASKELGPDMPDVLRQARIKHKINLPHLQALKQVANDGKHWKLRAVVMQGAGIAPIGGNFEKQYFGVPADAFANGDRFEFHKGAELNDARGYEFLLGMTIEGLKVGVPDSIWGIFTCSSRFVQGMIDAVEEAAVGAAEAGA
jgi:hypothetical protein